MLYFHPFPAAGESTLTDAMTAAGKTYEEIAQMVAEQVGTMPVGTNFNITALNFSKGPGGGVGYTALVFLHE